MTAQLLDRRRLAQALDNAGYARIGYRLLIAPRQTYGCRDIEAASEFRL